MFSCLFFRELIELGKDSGRQLFAGAIAFPPVVTAQWEEQVNMFKVAKEINLQQRLILSSC